MSFEIIQEVDAIYRWLDEQLEEMESSCRACGDCCDFESFGHKLYVTTPELMYFQHHLGSDIKEMPEGICPYRIDDRCTVYPHRFSGCRIFSCKGDVEKENAMCEQTIGKLKLLCNELRIPYHYLSLQTGLEMLRTNGRFKTQN